MADTPIGEIAALMDVAGSDQIPVGTPTNPRVLLERDVELSTQAVFAHSQMIWKY